MDELLMGLTTQPSKAIATPLHEQLTVIENLAESDGYRRLRLDAPWLAMQAGAGQFTMITVARHQDRTYTLPRPMAIHRRRPDSACVDIVVGAKGEGTRALMQVDAGQSLAVTGPLGRGFTLHDSTTEILLIGRGVGICSLWTTIEDAVERGIGVTMISSSRTRDAMIGRPDARDFPAVRYIEVTDDLGNSQVDDVRALLDQLWPDDPPQQVFTCGSHRLLRLVAELATAWGSDAQVSLEANMACGLGYCHGCSTATNPQSFETPLVCVDGPVFTVGAPRTDGADSERTSHD